ncbi:uncharacterized protein LOC144343388, partial [Saccoglossus kowalevskii]
QTIAKLMRALDPEGVEMRSKKRFKRGLYHSVGPNQTWHMDGYDKLKPYSICISGCIDGYSRKILWVKAASTNSDPSVIAYYYLNCVDEMKGCPLQIRAEQTFFANQRIECFWSFLLRSWTEWWRQYFASMVEERLFSSRNHLHKCLIRHCYLEIVQIELDQVITQWNNHPIRHQKELHVPCGIPNILYHCPELSGWRDMIQPVTTEEVCHHAHTPNYVGDEQIDKYIDHAMKRYKLLPPKTTEQAKHLYCQLKAMVEADSQ